MLGTGISLRNKTQLLALGSSERVGGRWEAGKVKMLGSSAMTVWLCDWYKARGADVGHRREQLTPWV